ncbi:hypothetical protein [Mycobacterium sp. TY814]|uniref:hypothetical protein n=1 Tax=unclassified Mycobacterium TaxID=2642494 RepID=UPI002740EE55|nr:hypothetical protein [Mycobacterium sp. TY814]MDP7724022.1 hypothetical protein [Mycobacterium sp. TY814]
MSEEKSAPAQLRRARRPIRLIWIAAVIGGVAVSFGAAEAQTLGNAPTSITATPEDPCLLTNTCGLESQIAEDEQQGRDFQAYCDELKLKNITIPECEPA